MDVLWRIRGHGQGFRPFVANRIGAIQMATEPSQWQHVPTEKTPSDLCTRGATPDELLGNSLWWHGPKWLLSEDKAGWPKINVRSCPASLPELKTSYLKEGEDDVAHVLTCRQRYSKPQPSVMPDVDFTLRLIAQWKHLIATDLTNAFCQIPLFQDSMKYCGVATPFKEARVYVRSAMGMPGCETALEELICRVLGHLIHKGIVVKIADDLYCGGNTPYELLENWKRVLQAIY